MGSTAGLQRSLRLAVKIQGWQGNTFAFWKYGHSVYIGLESRDFEASHLTLQEEIGNFLTKCHLF